MKPVPWVYYPDGMLVRHKLISLLCLLTLGTTILELAGVGFPGGQVQSSKDSPSNAPMYFPPSQSGTPIFAVILPSLGEPSLFEAAKDASVHSIRFSYFLPVLTREIAVRLVVDGDGKGQIVSAVSSGAKTQIKRAQSSVSNTEVNRLLQLMDKAGFWSMTNIETSNGETDAPGRKMYVMDGAWRMLEAAQHGSYHYAYRRNPEPGPFTEVGCYLANNLAKRDDSLISFRRCASSHP